MAGDRWLLLRIASCAVVLGTASARADSSALVEALDSLHLRRDDPAAQRTFRDKLDTAPAADREDFEVLWRAARFQVWLGSVASDPQQKRTLGTAAAALGKKVIALKPQRVEGHYYAALGIGIYCQGTGVVKILREGRDREFTAELDRALAIDPFFERGGPLLAKGRYYFELPWPMRDRAGDGRDPARPPRAARRASGTCARGAGR